MSTLIEAKPEEPGNEDTTSMTGRAPVMGLFSRARIRFALPFAVAHWLLLVLIQCENFLGYVRPKAPGLFDTTQTTWAFSRPSAMRSSKFCKVVPLPLRRTARRMGWFMNDLDPEEAAMLPVPPRLMLA